MVSITLGGSIIPLSHYTLMILHQISGSGHLFATKQFIPSRSILAAFLILTSYRNRKCAKTIYL